MAKVKAMWGNAKNLLDEPSSHTAVKTLAVLAGDQKSARNFVDIAGQLVYVNGMNRPASGKSILGNLKWRIGVAVACVVLAGAVTAFFLNRENNGSGSVIHAEPLPDFRETKLKAESGDSQAQNSLGEIYAEGKQVRQDYAEAVQWYRKAADQGLAKAQYNLGVLYDIGQGVSKDEAEAAEWYRKAAAQGSADAQYTLASMYGLGRGVRADPKEALNWYQRAAEQGDVLASYNLAERYERGKDVPVDLVEAYKWHCLAAERGLRDAAAAKTNLERQMTSKQLGEARIRIREFKARFPRKP